MAGFIVARTVGNAVVRNRVKRRLRELVAELLRDEPTGLKIVVRALPASAEADFAELTRDLRSAWDRNLSRLAAAGTTPEKKGTDRAEN
jgi:ribonuclease P protein component